jgi:hypothetical protein
MKKLFKRLFPSKEMKAYRKMAKRHRKELIKFDKKGADYDYCYLHNYVVMKIKHMYEYYSSRNNVWQADETLVKVVETLKHAIELSDAIDNVYDDSNIPLGEAWKVEEGLYKEFYKYIGENIQWWWD